MRDRQELQDLLVNVLDSNYVYFQPPASIKLEYPCIIYDASRIENNYANNNKFINRIRYSVTYVTKDAWPISTIQKLEELPYSSFDRHYVSDNLHHFVYTIYY